MWQRTALTISSICLRGKPQPLQDGLRHVRADLLVAVEMDAAGLRVARSGHGLGDIVQQHRPRQRRVGVGRQMLQHQAEMVEDGAFGMEIGRLLAGHGGGDFRQHLFEQAAGRSSPSPREATVSVRPPT